MGKKNEQTCKPKQVRPLMGLEEIYAAVCDGRWNFDPIRNRRPDLVWSELEKATGRDRKELKAMGWRVKKIKLADLPPRPVSTPSLAATQAGKQWETPVFRPLTPEEEKAFLSRKVPTFGETYGWPLLIVAVVLVILAASWF